MKKIIAVLLKKTLPLVCMVCMFTGCAFFEVVAPNTTAFVEGVGEVVGGTVGAVAGLTIALAETAASSSPSKLYGLNRISKGVYTVKVDASAVKNNEKTRDDTITSFVNVLAQERGYESYNLEMKTIQNEKKPKQISHWEYTITMPGATPIVKNSSVSYKINDNLEWTAITDTAFNSNASDVKNSIQDIVWGNNMFVAVGGSMLYKKDKFKGYGESKIAYSPDGITWTAVTNTTFKDKELIRTVAYGDGKFVAGSSKGNLAYSQDGVNWTAVKKTTSVKLIRDIAYGNGKFIAVGGSKILYSPDCINWTAKSPFTFFKESIYAVAYGDNKFVAGSSSDNHPQNIAYSLDGLEWESLGRYLVHGGNTIAYMNGKFTAVCYNGNVVYSPDGVKWTDETPTLLGSIYAIAYGDGKFVAGDKNGKTAYSQDGITWTRIADSAFEGYYINSIAYGDGKFVAVGNNGKISYWDGNIK